MKAHIWKEEKVKGEETDFLNPFSFFPVVHLYLFFERTFFSVSCTRILYWLCVWSGSETVSPSVPRKRTRMSPQTSSCLPLPSISLSLSLSLSLSISFHDSIPFCAVLYSHSISWMSGCQEREEEGKRRRESFQQMFTPVKFRLCLLLTVYSPRVKVRESRCAPDFFCVTKSLSLSLSLSLSWSLPGVGKKRGGRK